MAMKLISVEPTPSPNTMKLNMDERVERGRTYTAADKDKAPPYIRALLDIPGVKSVFQTADFIALDRHPKADWKRILAEAGAVLGGDAATVPAGDPEQDTSEEARVYVQVFRGIPMQIRVKTPWREVREGLPERFVRAATEAGMASPNLIKERKLEDHGTRYGEPEAIAREVMQELEAAYPDERLQALIERSRTMKTDDEPMPEPERLSREEALAALGSPDWRLRYRAVERLEPVPDNLDVLAKALVDEHVSVRRLAVVWLGEVKGERARELLCRAMEDPSPVVRRTAGDTLSDMGDPAAGETMIRALSDPSKLVRWRAARFLYDLGDHRAVEALRRAAEDEEFEVALQARMALERIEGGREAEGTVWQQMTQTKKKP
jgi:hypothetical protein